MSQVTKPPALKPGDTVAIIAPSEPVKQENLTRLPFYFEKKGYKTQFSPNILKATGDYVAGSPQDRAADFNWAFVQEDIKAIFVAVGGYGASQILDRIDFDLVKKHPKILAGYSDATTLQLAVFAKTGLVTFHSPNALRLPDFTVKGYTINNFWKMLTTINNQITIQPQSVWQEVVPGAAEGILFGGNLECVSDLLGTPWNPINALPKIFDEEQKYLFFWEEASVQFSKIIKTLWQIRNTGFFSKVSGMLVGKLTDVAEKDYQNLPSKKSLLREVAEPFGFPIIYGVDLGHEVPQMTIPVGVKASMDTKSMKLEILESAVL